jgi:hypothetical protein
MGAGLLTERAAIGLAIKAQAKLPQVELYQGRKPALE